MTSQLDGGPDLSGRTALVTGAASGIGLACARRLASAGADVVVADIRGDAAEDAAKAMGGSARVVDLSDPDAADALARECVPDILVNNAGIQHVAPVQEFPPEVFSKILRVMVEAPFRLVRASLPAMYERGWGRIVNISSAHGLRASPYKSAYVTAKHALEGLSKVIALEGASHGVTSNCVCPGYVRTPLVEGQIEDQARAHGMPPEKVTTEVLLARTAVKRLIEPDEVAEVVAYLCGPSAAMMTGASLTIDGGWTAH
jgi:3-hydroxybutyrate dehydrogenase